MLLARDRQKLRVFVLYSEIVSSAHNIVT